MKRGFESRAAARGTSPALLFRGGRVAGGGGALRRAVRQLRIEAVDVQHEIDHEIFEPRARRALRRPADVLHAHRAAAVAEVMGAAGALAPIAQVVLRAWLGDAALEAERVVPALRKS